MKLKITILQVVGVIFLIMLLLILRPAGFLAYSYLNDKEESKTEISGIVSDASNLNETKVDTVIKIFRETDKAIAQIADLIRQARGQGKKISIAGAQHSMGGHTIFPDGIILDMKSFNYMKLDSSRSILHVGSGAIWANIIPYLDSHGKSVAVMQSNNSFSVGGSLSVNCHGWQKDSPPISSTVESFRLINSDGKILTCSRLENAEMFSLVLGGYGLFGVILDVKLKVVDNVTYRVKQYVIQSTDYVKEFRKHVTGRQNIGMAYGRININPNHFMDEAILSTYAIENDTPAKLSKENTYPALRRTMFRSSVNSDYGKNLRWRIEKAGTYVISDRRFSRNTLLNEGVEVFQNTDLAYTDILHEYFVPVDSADRFIVTMKKIIPGYKVDLLNITVRNVLKDDDTFLAYANQEVLGFVMLFNQKRDAAAEGEMMALTHRLIEAAVSLRGTYYLPYRLHATKDQMYQAHPRAKAFFQLKKKYDPGELFRNQFYETYKENETMAHKLQ